MVAVRPTHTLARLRRKSWRNRQAGLALALVTAGNAAGQDESLAEAARTARALREAAPAEVAGCGVAATAVDDARARLAVAVPAEFAALQLAEQVFVPAQTRLVEAAADEWAALKRAEGLLLGSVNGAAVDAVLGTRQRLAAVAPREWAAFDAALAAMVTAADRLSEAAPEEWAATDAAGQAYGAAELLLAAAAPAEWTAFAKAMAVAGVQPRELFSRRRP